MLRRTEVRNDEKVCCAKRVVLYAPELIAQAVFTAMDGRPEKNNIE